MRRGQCGAFDSADFQRCVLSHREVLQPEDAGGADSTCGSNGLLDYPHYTRPAEFRGMAVPEVLINGNHLEIRRWRREQALKKTMRNRPDLLERVELGNEDEKILSRIKRTNEGK